MLKIQMALIALLIGCLTFTSCDLIQPLLTPEVPEETVPEETVPEETMPVEEMATEGTMPDYASWMSVTYAAFDPTHGQADRTVYINNVGAMALQAGMTTYPVGTIVVKTIMSAPDASGETSVAEIARMEKSDDPMYATEDGWLYDTGGSQAGCHGCHAKAGTDGKPGMDAVFTPFQQLADMGGMADMGDVDDTGDMGDMDAEGQ